MTDYRNCCHEQSLPGLYCCFWKPFFGGKLHKQLCLPQIILNPFTLEKGLTPGLISRFSLVVEQSNVVMRSFCLLTSMELILSPNAGYCI